jgi:alcohol dehydrogenase class IV
MDNDYSPFSVGGLPEIRFGSGSFERLPALLGGFGRRGVLVTGEWSFQSTRHFAWLDRQLADEGFEIETVNVAGEPTPSLVDAAVEHVSPLAPEFVLAVGGGSALDAGKAIAGLVPVHRPVTDYLEGVGAGRVYAGPALPLVAVPTTAGTGSEATRNAVIGVRGENGFKKSFRHDLLVARVAVVDPDLLAGCPPPLIAGNGMDALTQLIEGFVSTRASVFTDALARSGLAAVRDGLLPMYASAGSDPAARDRMAWAALASGIVLAQAGLGSVHGLASPLGAYFPIPHGVACGTLLAEATAINVRAIFRRGPDHPALDRYQEVATILTGESYDDPADAGRALVTHLAELTETLRIERLSAYGVGADDIARLVAGARGNSMKTNPVLLEDDEIAELVERRL